MLFAARACDISHFRGGGCVTLENTQELSSMLNSQAAFSCVEGRFRCILAGLLIDPRSCEVRLNFTELYYLKFKEEV